MISRRLLRVKALHILYAYRTSATGDLPAAEKELLFSITKSYDLYHLLMLMVIDMADYARGRIEIAQVKYFPTDDEANPNMRFVNNQVIDQIRNHPSFQKYLNNRKISWVNESELIKRLYRDLLSWNKYEAYMKAETHGYREDREFVVHMIGAFINQHPSIHQVLEEQSIYWNDDLDFVTTMVIKTIERSKMDQPPRLLKMFKNDDDRSFVLDLFRKTVLHGQEYETLIKEYTENWDFDRLAIMDILIMELAITEAIQFPGIPVKVTLNEYIEISKYYSTLKSNQFINGILDKIFIQLKNDQVIRKRGRGLIGEQSG